MVLRCSPSTSAAEVLNDDAFESEGESQSERSHARAEQRRKDSARDNREEQIR